MDVCEICKKNADDLFQCNSCSSLFCKDCGNHLRALCGDCSEFVETSQIEGLEDLE
jgi:hypothetical protein